MVVPMGSATYFHVAILERTDPLGTSVNFKWFGPISGLIFFILTLQLWQIGVRHYQSTGS
jgi:ABC-2 type transport system permease protein